MRKIGQYFRRNAQREIDVDFPKICTRAPFGPSAYVKQIFLYFPANNSISDDKSSRQRQHRRPAASAQHNTHAVIATLNVASRLVYPQPELINLRVQHQKRWRWSEASRSRGAACLCELLLEKEPSCIYEGLAHTAHNTPQNKNNTTQHNTQDNQHPNSQPNYSTTSRWKTPTRFLLSRRALPSKSWGSDIVRRALALLHSRPEAVIFR